ncbi:hypothetical protein, unlikely [Trypanosoma brucei gambiense DAL972]|uniref:Uncharacterized protein n=1 Tax=Trypanosoma brucei gambiense (strain MHOM/CI/86/DAL972) TaxID=679716 RepID=C9ZHZ8_TRYB9|nr:hypothetical protein, unlikely [Trypanosoma brucei gambiense DAL972]CBH09115.1 hypothetical protein, unlikely [Trypanosoma brucei gambiense DAL972]|eukprot:XP_011771556.1 hypothetical protein, unlikely [Trypanosoma brucei gambiense DAL972]
MIRHEPKKIKSVTAYTPLPAIDLFPSTLCSLTMVNEEHEFKTKKNKKLRVSEQCNAVCASRLWLMPTPNVPHSPTDGTALRKHGWAVQLHKHEIRVANPPFSIPHFSSFSFFLSSSLFYTAPHISG